MFTAKQWRSARIAVLSVVLAIFTVGVPRPGFAVEPTEELDVGVPQDWKVIREGAKEVTGSFKFRLDRKHYVPKSQSEEKWSEKIIVFRLRRILSASIRDHYQIYLRDLEAESQRGRSTRPAAGVAAGQTSLSGIYLCPQLIRNNQGAVQYLKVIEGRKHVYLVARIWLGNKFASAQLVASLMNFLNGNLGSRIFSPSTARVGGRTKPSRKAGAAVLLSITTDIY